MDCWNSFVEVRRTPVVMDWNVSRDARKLERAAVRELIDAGYQKHSADGSDGSAWPNTLPHRDMAA